MAKIKAIKSYKLVSGETRYKFKIYLGTTSTGKRIETTRRGFKTITAATNEYLRLKIKFKEGYRPEKRHLVIFIMNGYQVIENPLSLRPIIKQNNFS